MKVDADFPGLCGRKATLNKTRVRAQELCESRRGRPGLCGRKATLNKTRVRAQELCESLLLLRSRIVLRRPA